MAQHCGMNERNQSRIRALKTDYLRQYNKQTRLIRFKNVDIRATYGNRGRHNRSDRGDNIKLVQTCKANVSGDMAKDGMGWTSSLEGNDVLHFIEKRC